MRKIHLNRDRQNLGQYSPEEVAAGLRDGRFLPTDLAWREGMESWQPLATFTDLPAPEDAAAEPTPPLLAPGSDAGLSPVGPAQATGPAMPEWERRDEVGLFPAALTTVRQVFANPIVTFRDLRRTGGFIPPLVFTYVLQIVCGLVGLLLALVWVRLLPAESLTHLGPDPFGTTMTNLLVTLPTMIVGGLVFPFLLSGIYFVVIKLITKRETTYETVFRAYCYTMGAVAVVNLLPVPPLMFIQLTYMVFVLVIAFGYLAIAMREAVGLTTVQAVLVVTLPILICCFCFAGLIGGAAALAGSIPALQEMGR